MGLRCRNPPRHLSQLKALAIPLTSAPNGKELCRPSKFFHGLSIGSPKSKYQSSVSGQEYSGEQRGACHCVCVTEVTSPDAALTGNDVTWNHLTGSDVITGSMFCTCPEVDYRAFFLTIAVVRNVQLRMTGSSMANGCDMHGSHVTGSDGTGSDIIFPRFLLTACIVLV